MIQGERQFDLVVRMQEPFRSDENAIKNLLIATPDGQYLPLSQFCDIQVENGASFIYREANSRYIGVQFSVEGRDLASAVGEAREKVDARGASCPSATGSTGAASTRTTWRRARR